jgi:hypothetical protein
VRVKFQKFQLFLNVHSSILLDLATEFQHTVGASCFALKYFLFIEFVKNHEMAYGTFAFVCKGYSNLCTILRIDDFE